MWQAPRTLKAGLSTFFQLTHLSTHLNYRTSKLSHDERAALLSPEPSFLRLMFNTLFAGLPQHLVCFTTPLFSAAF
jgi:hypothetical protein